MSRTQKDKEKALQERYHSMLSGLLRDEDNKYCVDCDAKGPRWASWNLGIFLCIRCAGIHRNLGVHISKVKSVNLDSWTPEQMAMVHEMGNSRARAVYEANLPDGFRRPQTDSSLEAFIRAKYENKKYIAKEWVPPKPRIPNIELDDRNAKKKSKLKSASIQLQSVPKAGRTVPVVNGDVKTSTARVALTTAAVAPVAPSSVDLLGLDTPAAPIAAQRQIPTQTSQSNADPFGDFLVSTNTTVTTSISQSTASQNDSSEANLFDTTDTNKSTKDSILALYGPSNQTTQPQQYGVPGGMYMPQQSAYMMGFGGVMPNVVPQQMNPMIQPYNMQQPKPMMMNANAGNMGAYPVHQQQQQQYVNQVQNQLANMSMAPGVNIQGGYMQPQGTVAAGAGPGGAAWSQPQSGHTMASSLWQ